MPTVSPATVYKTLNELVRLGKLKRFEVDGVAHFDPDLVPHAEAVCLGCGTIADVALSVSPPTVTGGFVVSGFSLTLDGWCSRCASSRSFDGRRTQESLDA